MENIKKLTILHSNDLHGDFIAERIDEKLIGGVSMLSGYVGRVRRKEKNTIYCIATSCREVLDEYLSCHQNLDHQISGRLLIQKGTS